ncbi:hypothetical protein HPP92_020184 [Vanilla planifolia]|uniref:Uncharacterized protein n=1 Tax=Vanilla planifolia TaxID=51239 RepID=A0A835Q859_VANPL|nr:hypothetical protein HPP92_020184 [Vanilla planifolia]
MRAEVFALLCDGKECLFLILEDVEREFYRLSKKSILEWLRKFVLDIIQAMIVWLEWKAL